jgi:hypothetical protein
MTVRHAAIWLAVTLLPGSLFAQVLSEQQLDYLRQQFIEATAESVDGSLIQENTLPVNRIQGLIPPAKLQAGIPANKIIEADPVALPVATNAVALAQAAQATADSAVSTGSTLSGNLSSLSGSVSSISNSLNSLAGSVGSISNAVSSIQTQLFYTTTYTTNLVFPLVGQTVTLFIANGLITNTITEGP